MADKKRTKYSYLDSKEKKNQRACKALHGKNSPKCSSRKTKEGTSVPKGRKTSKK